MKLKRYIKYWPLVLLVIPALITLMILSESATRREVERELSAEFPVTSDSVLNEAENDVPDSTEETDGTDCADVSPSSVLSEDSQYMQELKSSLSLLSQGASRIFGTGWQSTVIENVYPVDIITENGPCDSVLVQFSGENGFILVDRDFTVYEYSFDGSFPDCPADADRMVYMFPGGFFYEKNGELYPLEEDESGLLSELENMPLSDSWDGQIPGAEGCGKIIDTDAYMKDRFGEKWKLYLQNSLDIKGFSQMKLSCYETVRADGTVCSEGNCWLCAPFIVLQYFADNLFPLKNGEYLETGFPSDEARVPYIPSADEPKIYALTYDSEGNNVSSLVKNAAGDYIHTRRLIYGEFDFPLIWTDMRRVSNALYGEIEDGSIFRTRTMLEVTSGRLGFDLNTSLHLNSLLGKYLSVKSVDRGLPFIFTTAEGTYGSHTMAACGYKIYAKELKLWRFTFRMYKIFFELRDGHTVSPVYYDVSSYKGLGGIVLIEKE